MFCNNFTPRNNFVLFTSHNKLILCSRYFTALELEKINALKFLTNQEELHKHKSNFKICSLLVLVLLNFEY